MKGGVPKTRSTRCWRRTAKSGARYTVCNKSKGQKYVYKRKTKRSRKTSKKTRKNHNKSKTK